MGLGQDREGRHRHPPHPGDDVIPFEESLELVRASGLSDGALVEGWVRPSAGGPGAAEGAGEGGGGPMKRVVVITGAGISAESGLKTFRGPDGLWRGCRPEEVASPESWQRAPRLGSTFITSVAGRFAGPAPTLPTSSPWPKSASQALGGR